MVSESTITQSSLQKKALKASVTTTDFNARRRKKIYSKWIYSILMYYSTCKGHKSVTIKETARVVHVAVFLYTTILIIHENDYKFDP